MQILAGFYVGFVPVTVYEKFKNSFAALKMEFRSGVILISIKKNERRLNDGVCSETNEM
jgi:hypothetical protein